MINRAFWILTICIFSTLALLNILCFWITYPSPHPNLIITLILVDVGLVGGWLIDRIRELATR